MTTLLSIITAITLNLLCLISSTNQQKVPTDTPNQYAEVYGLDDGSQRYQINSLDVFPDDDDFELNSVVINRVYDKPPVTKSPEVLLRRHRPDTTADNEEVARGAVGTPLIRPDDPYYTMDPEKLSRHKRDTSGAQDWQAFYRERHLAYTQKKEQEKKGNQKKTEIIVTSRNSNRGRGKFVRQFAGDETASDDDNNIIGAKERKQMESRIQAEDQQPEEVTESTTKSTTTQTSSTSTTSSTTTTKTSTIKKKPITTTLATTESTSESTTKKKPTTTTRATTESTPESTTETTTEKRKKRKHRKRTTTTPRPTTAEDPDDADAMTEAADIVHGLMDDMSKNKIKHGTGPMPSWTRQDLEHELDPRKNPVLRDLIVDKHNFLRSNVVPAAGNMLQMEWNDEAASIAQRWAEECKFFHDPGEVRITKQFHCGQNLARGWPKPLSWNLTMQLWFDERKDFVFDGHPRGMVGHYSQLVWAQSFQVGCAYKDCGTFHHYVCDYCPPGNVDSRIYKPYTAATKFCASCPNDCDESGKLCTNKCAYTNKYGNCDSLEKEFSVCTDLSYGLNNECKATCKCKGKVY